VKRAERIEHCPRCDAWVRRGTHFHTNEGDNHEQVSRTPPTRTGVTASDSHPTRHPRPRIGRVAVRQRIPVRTMSHVQIWIGTDNEAFQDGDAGIELSRILSTLAERTAMNTELDTLDGLKLFDVNGNRVGDVQVSA
jgi:hypothetical protein